jgi:pimeloyl-ACP methyl ester carboxylesterase
MRRSLILMLAAAMALFVPAKTMADDITPLGIGLEDIDYPYPVYFLDLTIEGQRLRMAYMDVSPAHPNGQSIVLLHGKNFDGEYWAQTTRVLADHGYRVIVPDQIGFGKSSKPDIDYHFDLLAANTKALLDHLGIARATIVGHSFGGMLAVYFARDYPQITARLVLENPIGLEDYRSAIQPPTFDSLFNAEMAQTAASYRSFMHAFFVGWPPEAEHSVDVFARVLHSGEYPRWAKASALTSQMIFNEPIRQEYPLLKMPVLLVIGQGDRSVFFRRYAKPQEIATLGHWPELGRKAAKDIPNAQLVEIQGSGHVPHLEHADEFNAVLIKFLSARY